MYVQARFYQIRPWNPTLFFTTWTIRRMKYSSYKKIRVCKIILICSLNNFVFSKCKREFCYTTFFQQFLQVLKETFKKITESAANPIQLYSTRHAIGMCAAYCSWEGIVTEASSATNVLLSVSCIEMLEKVGKVGKCWKSWLGLNPMK